MKKWLFFILFVPIFLYSQDVVKYQNNYGSTDINLKRLSQTDEYSQYNDIWGFVGKDGIEYAILGTTTGTVIYSLKDPKNPKRDTFIPGNTSIWRDMKSFKNHVYVTADQGNQGVLIINMAEAPNKITFKYSRLPAPTSVNPGNVGNCHNLWIDEKGFMYLSGCSPQSGGVLIYDLNANPDEPTFVGAADPVYSHDNYVRNDTLYSAEIYAGNFSVYHIKDKKNIVKLASQPTTTRFTHNVWLSDDHKYLFTTDEKPQGKVDAYSVGNPSEIKLLHSFRPPVLLNQNSLPHNTHYIKNAKGSFIVTSWYDEGVSVADVSDPSNMVEVGIGRTTKGGNGCWGAYPYLPSGLILASDMDNGLFVYEPNYTRAARFEGIVLDSVTKTPVNGAKISIEGLIDREILSDGFGRFKTGTPETGNINIIISKNGFETKKITKLLSNSISLKNDTIYLSKMPTSTLSGRIISNESGLPVSNAEVGLFKDANLSMNTKTVENGTFSLANIIPSSYQFSAGKWGYKPLTFKNITIPFNQSISEKLLNGYTDNFNFDLGWTVTNTATVGKWERGTPVGTKYNNLTSAPFNDSPNDEGNTAFVTGNIGGDPGVGDIDNGITQLHSPAMTFAPNVQLQLNVDIWFFNSGGTSTPNDTMFIYATNGLGDSILLHRQYENTTNWKTLIIKDIQKRIKIGTKNNFHFIVGDLAASAHLVEAGIDNFSVEQSIQTSLQTILKHKAFRIYPNPGKFEAMIQFDEKEQTRTGTIALYNQNGQLQEQIKVDGQENIRLGRDVVPGLYIILWQNEKGYAQIEKWIKME
ncbi:MAG: choice-of-anchor B family protein [Saprospiraceae bacterium]|nr:choice-of-anchor B family protein [Saprospiraceae bacterium]MDP4580614.1 choice-of-anchor B family protein [Saprospiraceae bacterium]